MVCSKCIPDIQERTSTTKQGLVAVALAVDEKEWAPDGLLEKRSGVSLLAEPPCSKLPATIALALESLIWIRISKPC